MKSFENFEVAQFIMPTAEQVLATIRRDEPCRANPLSALCTCETAKDDYLLGDLVGSTICQHCPVFEQKRQRLTADWEAWVLAMQDVYT